MRMFISGGLLLLVAPVVPAQSDDFLIDDTMAGYVHRLGSGSIVDVRATGTHDGSAWTVTFLRALATGDAFRDIEFVPGDDHYFQVATFDNAGGIDHDLTQANTFFTMSVPMDPGPLVFSGLPLQLTSLSGEYQADGLISITAVWDDATRDDRRAEWSYDGTTWTRADSEEDRLAIIWDLQDDMFVSAGTCTTMCHVPLKFTAPETRVDTWHWKATRTNPAGFADDQYWDDGQGGTVSGRKNDPGVAPFRGNASGDVPESMGEDGNGANAKYLFERIEGLRDAVAFDAGVGEWLGGHVLSGYVQRIGSGSRIDVTSTGSHDGENWSVTFRRKLDTGDAMGDIVFVPGDTYSYQVATFDNTGGIGHNMIESAVVHSMTLPDDPGPIQFAQTPAQLVSVSGQLLASEELTITMTWADPTQDDFRRQWTFDGATWSQLTNNEDRLAVIWDMQEDAFVSAGTCTTMCHVPFKRAAPGMRVDTWHWKAARSHPSGYADDQYWYDGEDDGGNGRRNDFGSSVVKDNANVGGVPTFMSSAGPGVSAVYLFEHEPAAGWSRAIPFDSGIIEPTLLVKKGVLKVNFKKAGRDSLAFAGTFDKDLPPALVEGLTGTFEAAGFTSDFTMGKKNASAKNPNIKVKIVPKKGSWSVVVKKVALAEALGIADETILKPGVEIEIDWSLQLGNDWRLESTSPLLYRSKEGKKGTGKLVK